MSGPATQSPKKLNRKKELNVIYFVDSDKTRSFKLSLSFVKVLAVVVSVVLVWSLGSFWALWSMWDEKEQAHRKIKRNLAAIFEYQTRYDQVYEQAYPKTDSTLATVENSEQDSDSAAKVDETDITEQGTQQLAAKDVKPTRAPTPKPTLKRSVPLPAVSVENSQFSASGSTLVMRFNIRNTDSPTKALGYMWGIARYEKVTGKSVYVGFPRSLRLTGSGSASSSTGATRYNIRRFKPVQIMFSSPENVPGKFKSVKVVVMDREGNQRAYDIPVTIEVGADDLPLPAVREDAASMESEVETNVKGENPAANDDSQPAIDPVPIDDPVD